MPRKPLAFPPTFGDVEPGKDAYVYPERIRQLAKHYGRYWSFHHVPTTVALTNDRFAKSLASFSDHWEKESTFRELLGEYAEHNVLRPAGYADVFHEYFQSPKVSWSVNAALADCLSGGWQAVIGSVGAYKGKYYKYDMRSAYLWAATLGMPDTSTYTRSLQPWNKKDGVYRLRLLRPVPSAPFPYNQATECIATNAEIETYGLPIAEVLDGVCWTNTLSGEPIIDAIRKVSTWKQAGRSYWGRWGQVQKMTCVSKNKTWKLPNRALNIPWAHTIISRVKMRLWNFSRHALHVYVDSVITPDQLPTGDNLGDWRLEKTYNNGVIIRGPGQYGCIDELRLERMAGVAAGSPRRYNSILAPVLT